MLTVSDVQALIVITLGDAFVLNRRVRQQLANYAANSIAYRRTPAVIGTGWLSHYPVAWGYAWQHRTIRHSFLWWDWTETVTDTAFYVNNGWGGGGSGEWIDASTWFAGEIYP